MSTLLQKAKSVPLVPNGKVTKEHIELALAWVNDEISIAQAGAVLSKASGSNNYSKAYYIFANALKQHIKNGQL